MLTNFNSKTLCVLPTMLYQVNPGDSVHQNKYYKPMQVCTHI